MDKGKTFSVTLIDDEVSQLFLVNNNFEPKEKISWFGNGQDYQVPPEKGGSKTDQQDFVFLIENSEKHFIVRFEGFSYLEDNLLVCDLSISYHYCEWYPKCSEAIPCYDYTKTNNLLLAYKLITGKDLIK